MSSIENLKNKEMSKEKEKKSFKNTTPEAPSFKTTTYFVK